MNAGAPLTARDVIDRWLDIADRPVLTDAEWVALRPLVSDPSISIPEILGALRRLRFGEIARCLT